MKVEAKWQTIWARYVKEKKLYCFYELKQTKTDYFSFSKIRDVQRDGLLATKFNGFHFKFSDEISRPKPCDGVNIPPMPSYLVIKFPDAFYLIDIEKIEDLREMGTIGITTNGAEQLASKIIKV